jgi:hypothetical protein
MKNVDGLWELTVNSPLGPLAFTVDLKQHDEELRGLLHNTKDNVSTDLIDGRADGEELRWKAKLRQVRVTLTFTVRVTGDALAGRVKAGMFGQYPVIGKRATR